MVAGLTVFLAGAVMEYSAIKQVTILEAMRALLLNQPLASKSTFPWEDGTGGGSFGSMPTGGKTHGGPSLPGAPAVVQGMIAEADRMISLHLKYKWGGGHAGGYNPNGPWDCSGAVSYLLHHAGLLSGSPRVSAGFMTWGSGGKGEWFTVYANPGHVFILFADGTAWGTTRSTPGGGVGWHHHTTAGFVARHAQGY